MKEEAVPRLSGSPRLVCELGSVDLRPRWPDPLEGGPVPPLYLDYNATAPLDPRVFEAIRPWVLEAPANAGSRTHVYGQRAKDATERARRQVADLLGARSDEVLFTSGATESNNLVLLGVVRHALAAGRRHVLASAVEHKS